MNYRNRLFVAFAALAVATSPAAAQDFTIQSASNFKMGGVLGLAARLGGANKEMIETTYLSGHKMRTDSKDYGSIINADDGVITTIDKRNKSYTTMTFDEMAAMMRQMQAEAQKSAQQSKKSSKNDDVEMKYTAKVDVTGEQQKIAGFNAKRSLLTLTIDASARPEEGGDMQKAGTMVFLVDMWNADDAPHAKAMKSFNEAYAKKASKEFGSMARGMEALFSSYPGAKEGLEAAGKEMQKISGVQVKTVTYVVLVPADKKLDRDLVLNAGKDEKAGEEKKGGFGKALGGMLGPKKASEGSEQQAEMKQSTLATVTTEVRDVQAGGVPADAFTIPAGYKQKKMGE